MRSLSKFKRYNLTESQIRGIGNIVIHEQGNIAGWYWEASQIANLAELRFGGDPVRAVKSGWYAHGTARYNAKTSNKTVIEIVRRVFNYGFRVLPAYINEHDCLSDIRSIVQNGRDVKHDKSRWVPHETVIKNRMGSTYVFYGFPGGYKSGNDPFGYTSKENRKKFGDFHYTLEEARTMPVPFVGHLPSKFPTRGYFKVGDGYLSAHSMTAEIKAIQAFLNWALRNNKDHKELVLDGLYGGNTKKMTTLFQRNRGLKENGCFGKLCLAEAKKMI